MDFPEEPRLSQELSLTGNHGTRERLCMPSFVPFPDSSLPANSGSEEIFLAFCSKASETVGRLALNRQCTHQSWIGNGKPELQTATKCVAPSAFIDSNSATSQRRRLTAPMWLRVAQIPVYPSERSRSRGGRCRVSEVGSCGRTPERLVEDHFLAKWWNIALSLDCDS